MAQNWGNVGQNGPKNNSKVLDFVEDPQWVKGQIWPI